MRIIKKEAFLAAFVLSSLLLSVNSYADPEEGCPAGESCAPCGYVSANVSNVPSDAQGFNPLINYTASAELIKCRGYFGGFYLGAAYGLGDINYHLEIPGNSPFELDNDARSYFVTVFNGGYNLILDHFFLGAELGYNYRSRNNPISYYDIVDFLDTTILAGDIIVTEATSFPCKVRVDINSQHAVTADLLPGFVYSRFVGYLRLGYEQTMYSWHRRVCFPSITVNTVTDNAVVIEGQDFVEARTKSTSGYRLGVGFGVAAGAHVSFHLNYIHTFGNKMSFTPLNVDAIAAITPIIAPSGDVIIPTVSLGQLAANTTFEPQRDEVTFGVKFRF